MLGAYDLDIKFHESWQDEHKSHFLSQLILAEVTKNKVFIQYDGGGFSDRHSTTISVINKLFESNMLQAGKKFYIFTGDNRPEGIQFDHAYFSIAGKRKDQKLIVPDPYNFSWNYIGANSYDSFRKLIFENSQKLNLQSSGKAYWRGSTGEHPIREELFKKAETISFLDFKKAIAGDHTFEPMSECGKHNVLIDLPGRGWSARLKYSISSFRPVVVYPREEWDWASMILEPGVHYILTLPSTDDLIHNCGLILSNKEVYNFYTNSALRIINEIGENQAMVAFADTINRQAD